jgi:DNA polymerase I-like protein with 3'-5' exonuclease and polymerase domains
MNPKYRLFDLETDGLLDTVTRVHVLVVYDQAEGWTRVFRRNETEDTIEDGIQLLLEEGVVAVAHNGTNYDCEVLKKLYGVVIPWQRQRDTMVLSRLIWSDLKDIDMARRKKKAGQSYPGNLIGLHSLEAWGHRLGEHKGDYRGDPAIADEKARFEQRWARWNQSMEDYCVQDIVVTRKLWELILSKGYDPRSVLMETQVAYILNRQERHGFPFDEQKAVKLYAKLAQRRLELEAEVRKVFRPLFLKDGKVFTPAKDSKAYGYVAGAPLTKVKLTEFNPTSRDHVAYWLKVYYSWEPEEFTQDGKPKVDDDVISKLDYPEAAPLKEYFMVVKRLGQLAEGKEAWLKAVGKDGRIHGRVNTNGAVTGRMTHSKPNMAQVPASRSPYGHECRELFYVHAGKLEVGCDADALELRCLAGYMAPFDGGAYIDTVLRGDKSKGTDMHSVNCRALGMDPKAVQWNGESGRDVAKTWFYAFIYGAGDEKLGLILTGKKGDQARKRGAAARKAFLTNLPAMGKLVEYVQARALDPEKAQQWLQRERNPRKRELLKMARGHLVGLDGRLLKVRSSHAALNTLLQSAGALLMKKALCILDDSLQRECFVPGIHYEFLANVHDEWQLEVNEDIAETVGRMAVQAIRDAGVFFNFRCPLDGAFDIGHNWAECH